MSKLLNFWINTKFCISFNQGLGKTIHPFKISNYFNYGLLTGMVLTDVQKAFDTIDYYILLQRFPLLGSSNEVIGWFSSYLRSRIFYVNVHDKFSTTAELRCGIEQGFILGPWLFLLYVNDMPQAVDCDLFLYADDTFLLYQHKDLNINMLRMSLIYCLKSIWSL